MNLRRFAACIIVLLPAVADAAPAAYTFTNITDSTMRPSSGSFSLARAVIDGNTVAVKLPSEVFKYDLQTSVLTTIAKVGDPAPIGVFPSGFATFGQLDVSNGAVTFAGSYTTSPINFAVFAGSGGSLTTIAKEGDVTPLGTITSIPTPSPTTPFPAISGGAVAFSARTSANFIRALYRHDAGGVTVIAKDGDAVGSITIDLPLSAPAVALQGDRVAFLANYNGLNDVIVVSDGGPLTAVAKSTDLDSSGAELGSFRNVALSGNFVAFDSVVGVSSAIYVGNGGPLTTIAKTADASPAGTFISVTLGGFANNGSDVLFQASLSSSGSGLFLNSSGVNSLVLKTGDMLFGLRVIDLSRSAKSLDPGGSGKIVFRYTLANGVSGIALATPVPEPAALTLAIAPLAIAIRRRAR
jgi:hypothetical protein